MAVAAIIRELQLRNSLRCKVHVSSYKHRFAAANANFASTTSLLRQQSRNVVLQQDNRIGSDKNGLSFLQRQHVQQVHHHHHHHHHLSLNREGRWGITDDFTYSIIQFSLFSTALWELPNSRPVHFLMLSSHLVLCLSCLLLPCTVPCKMVLARPDERET